MRIIEPSIVTSKHAVLIIEAGCDNLKKNKNYGHSTSRYILNCKLFIENMNIGNLQIMQYIWKRFSSSWYHTFSLQPSYIFNTLLTIFFVAEFFLLISS